jgi:hypothetical protein
MPIWVMCLVILGAGAVGGVGNALITDNGFPRPRWEQANGTKILRPGIFGNVLLGAFGALVTWGLLSSVSTLVIFSGNQAMLADLTVGTFVGAVIAGLGGARVLTAEVDKNLLRAAASQAAMATPDSQRAGAIAMSSSPAAALDIAKNMPR